MVCPPPDLIFSRIKKRGWARRKSALSHPTRSRSRKERCVLLVPRIEIVGAGYCGCGHAVGARAMRPAAAAWEALALTGIETAGRCADLRLRSGDERRQPVDAGIIRNHRLRLGLLQLRLWLKLRLRTVLAMFTRRMLFARLVRLAFTLVIAGIILALIVVARIIIALDIVARHERLRLHRDEAGLLTEMRETLALVVALLRRHFIFGARLRLVLAELLLRGGDQAEIMLGMLIVVLGGDRIAGGARIARQLHVFFRDMGRGAADLDVGPVRFEYPGHRVLAASAVVVIAVIVAVVIPVVTHPLVVLTVSHVLPLF